MRRQELIQILTVALVAVVGVGAVFVISLKYLAGSRAQDAPPPPEQTAPGIDDEMHKRLQQVPIGGEATSEALRKAQEAAASSEAAAAAIVDMPAVDPNQGRAQPPPPPNGSGGQAGSAANSGISGISELEGFLEPFIYDETNRRDPFLAFGVNIPVGDTEAPRILAPIQKFPLSDFKLVGVLWDVKTPKAMVVSSSQELFIVERDQSIGIDNGYVAAIRESEIVVVEPVKKRGDVTYKTTVLRMER
jgi:type IV pilus assembly protein PilP